MDSYTSMKQKLLPIGIYGFKENSVIDCELKAYAEGIDTLFNTLDEMTRECFIATAQTYGISEREKFTGKEHTQLSVDKRRERLIAAEQRMGEENNITTFKKFIESLDVVNYEIVEQPNKFRVDVKIHDSLTNGEKSRLKESIKGALPAYLNTFVKFSGEEESED